MKIVPLILLSSVLTTLNFADEIATTEPAQAAYEMIENQATLPLLNPDLADRKISKLRLNTGLEVYLISDPHVDQSAAGVAVEAGSWHDPKEYPGTAHFLEHMLFMGTKAYPQEFQFMQYITDNGGAVNAFTAPDRTVYMFSINNDAFVGAFDRFSHFFIDPLLSTSCIGRELHAVDQEHAKNIENDDWREYMILKETGNPAHPNASFSTGNAQTLSGIPQTALRNWYEEHYSADNMHLVVISPLPMEQLTDVTLQYFSQVPKRETSFPTLPEQMTSASQRGHTIYIKPIKDLRRVSLVWELSPELSNDIEHHTADLVAYVLQNQSEQSLIADLKRENLAESLSVSSDRMAKGHLLFRIDITLTTEGVSQTEKVITRCFEAVARLKEQGIPYELFHEMQTMAKIDYQYQSREDAFSFIMGAADNMVDEPLATYPEKSAVPTSYDQKAVSQFIASLTPSSCLFFVMADPALTGVTPTIKEKWMDAEYTIKEEPEQQLTAWTQVKANPNITLPSSNPFIPTQLAVLPPQNSKDPLLIQDDALGKIYFEQDAKYQVPELATIFSLKTPLVDGSPKSTVQTDLYLKALKDALASPLAFAKTAGLEPFFSAQGLKIQIALQGYSEKAPLLLRQIFGKLPDVTPSKEKFDTYKQSLLSSYDNMSKELPLSQAVDLLGSIVYNDAPTSRERYKALQALSYEEFLAFSKTLFKETYVEGVLYGNLSEQDATTLWKDLQMALATTPYPLDKQKSKEVLLLPEKHGPFMVVQKTARQGNAVLLVVEEGAFTFDKRAAQQILGKALQEGFFDTLRTKQQTAYIAKAWDSEVEKQLLQFFAVQSSTHHPRDLIARFELFLEDFLKNFQTKLSEERFENLRKMLITTLQMPPENLKGMAKKLNTLAFTYNGDFNWDQQLIASLEKLTYDELFEWAHLFLSRENPRRLAVLMEGVLTAENDFHYEHVSKEDICNLGTYSNVR